jgi:hypothetical protein
MPQQTIPAAARQGGSQGLSETDRANSSAKISGNKGPESVALFVGKM